MSDIIQNLLNNVLKDGARPSKYRCEVTLPSGFETNEKNLDIICKTASFPAKSNDTINIKFKGRNIPIPGQEKFTQNLILTFYLNESHKHKILFEEWMSALNYINYSNLQSNETKNLVQKTKSNITSNDARTQVKLTQLNFEGDLDRVSYVFYNVFPKEIGAIALSAETIAAISEFTVEFSYSHFEIIKLEKGINANNTANNILGGIQNTVNKIVDSAMGFIPNTNLIKSGNSSANKSIVEIQDAGKSISSSIDEFLG